MYGDFLSVGIDADAVTEVEVAIRPHDPSTVAGYSRVRRKNKNTGRENTLPVFISFMLSNRREYVHTEYSAISHR